VASGIAGGLGGLQVALGVLLVASGVVGVLRGLELPRAIGGVLVVWASLGGSGVALVGRRWFKDYGWLWGLCLTTGGWKRGQNVEDIMFNAKILNDQNVKWQD
jgi:hypothetical protein